MQKIIFSLFIFLSFYSHAETEVQACRTPTKECESVSEIVPGGKITYTSTFSLETPNPNVENAILMIHASDRKVAWGYNQLNKLIANGQLSKNTLLVAPLLASAPDSPQPGFLVWGTNDWSAGHNSLDATHTSSFAVLDALIQKMLASGNFPNLKTLIVTGFSAGGQATQRFALGTIEDKKFPDIHFRFIVASPSSYVYLNQDRWVPGSQFEFATPPNPVCAYNNYRYGGENLNSYMSQRPFSESAQNFLGRDLAFIVGEADDATDHPNPPIPNDVKDHAGLDISCEAKWQGRSRVERSFIFHQYLLAEFPQNLHSWFGVPGLAHTYAIYDDPRIVRLLNFQ